MSKIQKIELQKNLLGKKWAAFPPVVNTIFLKNMEPKIFSRKNGEKKNSELGACPCRRSSRIMMDDVFPPPLPLTRSHQATEFLGRYSVPRMGAGRGKGRFGIGN